jgi:heptosyltransferase-2
VVPFSKDKVDRILVIRTDRVGDALLTTPTLKALRKSFPERFIGLLTTPYTADLFSENGDINELIIYDRSASWSEKRQFVKALRRRKFDLAIILYPVFESAMIAYLSGATFRIGHALEGHSFLLTSKVNRKSRFKHEIEASLDVVRAIGVDTDEKQTTLPLSREAEIHAKDFFASYDISPSDLVVTIHPGAHEEHTRWMADRFAQVADELIERYAARVILLGAQADRHIIDDIRRIMVNKPIVADANCTLQKLGAIIKKSDVFLGNNSGPMHIAAAVRCPVVSLFGAIHPLENEDKWAPLGDEHVIVRREMDCVDCHPGHCKHNECLEMIAVQDVMAALDSQIKHVTRTLS